MSTPHEEETIIGTFADAEVAERAANAARKAGFRAERRAGGVVAVDSGTHSSHADEIRGILGAYGAREYSQATANAATASSSSAGASTTGGAGPGTASASREQRLRAEEGTRLELVEERLETRTQPVQTGEVTIRKEVVSETRTIEVPVRREELVIERHPVDRRPIDSAAGSSLATDPLVAQLLDRLRQMQPGETLRIPIVEEEVVIHKQPVVVEEITLGKRSIQETQAVTATVRREEARIEEHGTARVHDQERSATSADRPLRTDD